MSQVIAAATQQMTDAINEKDGHIESYRVLVKHQQEAADQREASAKLAPDAQVQGQLDYLQKQLAAAKADSADLNAQLAVAQRPRTQLNLAPEAGVVGPQVSVLPALVHLADLKAPVLSAQNARRRTGN